MDKVKHIKKYSFFNLPKFGRTTLEPVKLFSELIGNPYKNYKSIHIAGTNGKGTVSYKLARIMQHAGFRTGLFISPHLVKFNERISIDGEDISDDDLFRIENELYRIYEEQDSKPDLVIFDMITMIAFKYFEEKKVDYAIVEVGMGGTLDPTNIITPEISIITSIGYDHMQILGDTVKAFVVTPQNDKKNP